MNSGGVASDFQPKRSFLAKTLPKIWFYKKHRTFVESGGSGPKTTRNMPNGTPTVTILDALKMPPEHAKGSLFYIEIRKVCENREKILHAEGPAGVVQRSQAFFGRTLGVPETQTCSQTVPSSNNLLEQGPSLNNYPVAP